MPNRILKESICTSDTIDQLSWFEEVFFYRLIVNCDDYGRFDGRPAIIKSRLFPLKQSVTEKVIEQALDKLSTAGLVERYVYGNKPILQLVTWERHQQVRNKRSSYPAVDGSDTTSADENVRLITEMRKSKSSASICNQLISNDINCMQMKSIAPRIQSNTIQSESESESESDYSAERKTARAPQPEDPPVITLPLNTGEEYPVTEKQVEEWATLYPAVDVKQELRNMRGWLLANPSRRKTKTGILRFVAAWLAREQDRARAGPADHAVRAEKAERSKGDADPGADEKSGGIEWRGYKLTGFTVL